MLSPDRENQVGVDGNEKKSPLNSKILRAMGLWLAALFGYGDIVKEIRAKDKNQDS